MILVELPRGTEANLAESWWAWSADGAPGDRVLATHWPTSGAEALRSRFKTEEASGVMDYDMDLFRNESV
jgi:hypothetical protein